MTTNRFDLDAILSRMPVFDDVNQLSGDDMEMDFSVDLEKDDDISIHDKNKRDVVMDDEDMGKKYISDKNILRGRNSGVSDGGDEEIEVGEPFDYSRFVDDEFDDVLDFKNEEPDGEYREEDEEDIDDLADEYLSGKRKQTLEADDPDEEIDDEPFDYKRFLPDPHADLDFNDESEILSDLEMDDDIDENYSNEDDSILENDRKNKFSDLIGDSDFSDTEEIDDVPFDYGKFLPDPHADLDFPDNDIDDEYIDDEELDESDVTDDSKFEEYHVKIPTHAIPYLEYGDSSGLTDEDIDEIDNWQSRFSESTGKISHISYDNESPHFSPSPEFGKASDVVDAIVFVTKEDVNHNNSFSYRNQEPMPRDTIMDDVQVTIASDDQDLCDSIVDELVTLFSGLTMSNNTELQNKVQSKLQGCGFNGGSYDELLSYVRSCDKDKLMSLHDALFTESFHDDQNGSVRELDREDFFPSGSVGPASTRVGPTAAKNGDNPLSVSSYVRESNDSFAKMMKDFDDYMKGKRI